MAPRVVIIGIGLLAGVSTAVGADAQVTDATWRVTGLRTEYLETPIGLDEVQPRLSWRLESNGRGERQSAYRILVATEPARLEVGAADLWDSGRVASDRTSHIIYGGEPLRSRQRCYWKVIAWNRDGTTRADADSYWEMGLLAPQEWHGEWIGVTTQTVFDDRERLQEAQWIWSSTQGAGERDRYFRLAFTLPDLPVMGASLLITAADEFSVYLDDRAIVLSNVERRDWTHASRVDVTHFFTPGHNVLGVRVSSASESAGVLAHLRVRLQDGQVLQWPTDGAWLVSEDFRSGWNAIDFDVGAWSRSTVVAAYGEDPWRTLDLPAALAPSPYLRRGFEVTRPVRQARLYATALGCYEMHLNGVRVGADYFTPGWTDYRRRLQYQAYDVTTHLRQGRNVLGAILGDGWYAGTIGSGGQRHHYGPYPLGLRAQLHITYEDGTEQVVATDREWTASSGPILASDLLFGEVYDARLEMPSWSTPGFDATMWSRVSTLSPPGVPLVAQRSPTVQRTQELSATALTEPRPGAYIFDLGQNMVGWVRLQVDEAAGTEIRLRFAEMLELDGDLYTTNLRSARSSDVYITRGGGPEHFEPHFTFHGFRYVEVTGVSRRPSLESVTGVVLHSATRPTGSFDTSSVMLNQLQSNIQWSQRGNFLSVPTDCPQRDRASGLDG